MRGVEVILPDFKY